MSERKFKYKYNPELKERARELRANMTPEEKHIWYDLLKDYPIRFYRQRIADKYILDFYCPKVKLAVEIDGSKHFTEKGKIDDKLRTEALSKRGITVLRVANSEVEREFDSVRIKINNKVSELLELTQLEY